MAKIRNVGVPGKTPGILQPYVHDPRSFMDRETLEIDWDKVREYMKRHQDYWRHYPVDERW